MPYDRLIHVEPTADAALRWCERAARGEVPHGCHSGPGWPRVDASYMRGVSTHRPAPFRMRASIAPSLTTTVLGPLSPCPCPTDASVMTNSLLVERQRNYHLARQALKGDAA